MESKPARIKIKTDYSQKQFNIEGLKMISLGEVNTLLKLSGMEEAADINLTNMKLLKGEDLTVKLGSGTAWITCKHVSGIGPLIYIRLT